MAFLLEEGERCSSCGTKDSEWAENPFAYVAEAHWCKGCYVRDAEQQNTREAMPGTTIRLVANTPRKKAQRLAAEARKRARAQE